MTLRGSPSATPVSQVPTVPPPAQLSSSSARWRFCFTTRCTLHPIMKCLDTCASSGDSIAVSRGGCSCECVGRRQFPRKLAYNDLCARFEQQIASVPWTQRCGTCPTTTFTTAIQTTHGTSTIHLPPSALSTSTTAATGCDPCASTKASARGRTRPATNAFPGPPQGSMPACTISTCVCGVLRVGGEGGGDVCVLPHLLDLR